MVEESEHRRKLSPDDYRVSGLDALGNTDVLFSGYMPIGVSGPEGAFFFLLAMARKPTRKTVIWLNGGPGCSSMVGAMWENGPFKISKADDDRAGFNITPNPHSWNTEGNIIFVEQPIRTGFSLAAAGARTIRNEAQVAQDFAAFLQSFLAVFVELQGTEIYLTGESYAGMYIPNIAKTILKQQQGQKIEIEIQLKGVAIGNGAIDPLQDLSYTEYAYSHGLIPLSAKQKIDNVAKACYLKTVKTGARVKNGRCDIMGQVLEAAGGPNEYDTGTFNSYSRIVEPGNVFDSFLNSPVIQEALHVRGLNLPGLENFKPEEGEESDPEREPVYYTPAKWKCCNDDINEAFGEDFVTSVPAIQFLSSAPGVRVLLYSGERDLNTNHLGTLHTLESNSWVGGRAWSTAERSLWRFSGDVAGTYQTLNNGKFSFLVVRNGGHLLPMDLPAASLEMLRRFLNDESFSDVKLPSYGRTEAELALQGAANGALWERGGANTLATFSVAFISASFTLLLAALFLKRLRVQSVLVVAPLYGSISANPDEA